MDMNYFYQVLSLLLFCGMFVCGSKYDKHSNEKVEPDFRMKRVTALWKKAQKLIRNPNKLEDLKLELKKLDKVELELKHMQQDGKDVDGAIEAETRNRLLGILERYGLTRERDHENSIRNHHGDKKFSDERLTTLWQQAMSNPNFSPDELIQLQQELNHHEDKVTEYHALAGVIDGHDEITENHIEYHEKPNKTELNKMKYDLKDKYHQISNGISDLEKKIVNRLGTSKNDFEDSRILQLWRTAQQNNFTEEELKSIKVELSHFQSRVHKHQYWLEQQELLGTDDQTGNTHAEIKKKVDEHGRYIKKYHSTMMDRVVKREEL